MSRAELRKQPERRDAGIRSGEQCDSFWCTAYADTHSMLLPTFCPNFCRTGWHKDDWGNTMRMFDWLITGRNSTE